MSTIHRTSRNSHTVTYPQSDYSRNADARKSTEKRKSSASKSLFGSGSRSSKATSPGKDSVTRAEKDLGDSAIKPETLLSGQFKAFVDPSSSFFKDFVEKEGGRILAGNPVLKYLVKVINIDPQEFTQGSLWTRFAKTTEKNNTTF
ncbi:hypothetical protein PDO_5194 [Rhizobium sp. PDO1-076]|uniref:hypothetical protein n=1 Tax=Rhizobium sp. PDO1-076 TaxID=1125979 RepID=UPI00024E3E97|nr:hypothetical protein [Rhizobium sp. PDO1-076]EHS51285.1 hypothetical protein PDO_5194 [Rhizobium sp. PDO1-076]